MSLSLSYQGRIERCIFLFCSVRQTQYIPGKEKEKRGFDGQSVVMRRGNHPKNVTKKSGGVIPSRVESFRILEGFGMPM